MNNHIVSIKSEVHYEDFLKFVERYRGFRSRLLYQLGAEGYRVLYSSFVNGQELRYHVRKFKHGSKIRHNAYFGMTGNNSDRLTLRSNPMNLYERGFTQRNGRVERPRMVLTRKLPAVMRGRAEMIARKVDREMQDEYDKLST